MLTTTEQETFYQVLGNVVHHAIQASKKLPNVAILPEICKDLPEVVNDTIMGMKIIKYLSYTGLMVAHADSPEKESKLATCTPVAFTWEQCTARLKSKPEPLLGRPSKNERRFGE